MGAGSCPGDMTLQLPHPPYLRLLSSTSNARVKQELARQPRTRSGLGTYSAYYLLHNKSYRQPVRHPGLGNATSHGNGAPLFASKSFGLTLCNGIHVILHAVTRHGASRVWLAAS